MEHSLYLRVEDSEWVLFIYLFLSRVLFTYMIVNPEHEEDKVFPASIQHGVYVVQSALVGFYQSCIRK